MTHPETRTQQEPQKKPRADTPPGPAACGVAALLPWSSFRFATRKLGVRICPPWTWAVCLAWCGRWRRRHASQRQGCVWLKARRALLFMVSDVVLCRYSTSKKRPVSCENASPSCSFSSFGPFMCVFLLGIAEPTSSLPSLVVAASARRYACLRL